MRTEEALEPVAPSRAGGPASALSPWGARHLREYGIWLVLVVFFAYCMLGVDNFATTGNLGDILAVVPIVGVAALGQTFAVAVGGMDLSVGQVASLVGVLTLGLATTNGELLWVVPLMIALGGLLGWVNGVAIAVSGANPVIVTFAMLSVVMGLTYLYTEVSAGDAPGALSWIDGERLGGLVPVSFLIFLALVAVSWFVLARTVFGVQVRAVGSNEASSLRSGIRTSRIKMAVYLISGVSGALAGLLLDARLKTGYPGAGAGMELSVIVAVILGGTPFGGGRAKVAGTVAGVLLLSMLENMLNLLAIDAQVQKIVSGLVVAVAVALYSTRRSARWT